MQQVRVRHGERAREALVGEDEGIPQRVVPGNIFACKEGRALPNWPRCVPAVEAAAVDDANIADGGAAKVRPIDHERRVAAACRGGCERGAEGKLERRRACCDGLLCEAGREDRRTTCYVHGRLIQRVEAVAQRDRRAVVEAADAAQSASVVVYTGGERSK